MQLAHFITNIGESQQAAWEGYQGWLKGKTIGPPKATSAYTVERLRQMDIVGVYAEEELGEYGGSAQPPAHAESDEDVPRSHEP